jgi:hypothetical protein
MKPNQPSYLFIASVLVAIVSLFFSTFSPLVLLLVPLYFLPLVFKQRLPRDSATIWGGRLFLYALCAVIGRAPIKSYYYMGAQAFITMGLILGGELVLQSFREPPEGFKFDPLQFLVSGLLFALGFSFNASPHLWISAPLWMFLTLLSLGDVREDAPKVGALARVKQLGLIGIAVCGGFLGHSALSSNRNAISALGARLLSDTRPNVSEAGVADAPQMGSAFNPNASTSRLLRITGTLGDSHLRAAAFDTYQGGTWGPPLSTRGTPPALPDDTREQKSAITGNREDNDYRTDYNAKITVLRDTDKVVFAPLNSSALVPLGGTSFDWDRSQGPLQIADAPPISYGIVDSKTDLLGVQTEQGPLCVSLDPQAPDPNNSKYKQQPDKLKGDIEEWKRDVAFSIKERPKLLVVPPDIDPRVKQLAAQITRDAPTQPGKIKAISEYLMLNYKYSLNFVRTAQDPISDFLLNKKSAHCQYFAASAVMLLRSVGVPARYATGFWAHERAPDGTTVVRGRDAHAWAEAYVDKVGWVTVEVTPPSGRADPAVNPLTPWQKWGEQLEDAWTRVRNWFGKLSSLQILGLMLGMLALWGLERWRQARKRARALPAKPLPPLELQPLARGFERALQKRGITILDGQTWSEALPDQWQQEREWVEIYNLARFDERDQSRLSTLTEKLRAIERAKKN